MRIVSEIDKTVKKEVYKLIGKNVKMFRKEKKMSRKELAEKMGVHQVSIAQLEIGHLNMTLERLYILSNVLGVSITNILPHKIDCFENKEV